jgi:hypothetical protein
MQRRCPEMPASKGRKEIVCRAQFATIAAATLAKAASTSPQAANRVALGSTILDPNQGAANLAGVPCINPDFIAALKSESALLEQGAPEAAGRVNKYGINGSGGYISVFAGCGKAQEGANSSPSLEPSKGSGDLAGQWSINVDDVEVKHDSLVCLPAGAHFVFQNSSGVLTVDATGNTSWKCQTGCGAGLVGEPYGTYDGATVFSFFDNAPTVGDVGDYRPLGGYPPLHQQAVRFENTGAGKYSAARSQSSTHQPVSPSDIVWQKEGTAQFWSATERDVYSIVVNGTSLEEQRVSSVVSGVLTGMLRTNPDVKGSLVITPTPCRNETFTGTRIIP